MFSSKNKLKIIFVVLFCIVVSLFTLFIGEKYDLSSEKQLLYFLNLRVSRLVLGFMAGSILALAGLSFQTIFQNSLASPFTLGIASGASLGAAFVIKFDLYFEILGVSSTFIGAFSGALFSIFFINILIKYKKTDKSYVMLLSGIAFNFLASSLVMLLQYTGDLSNSFKLARWTMGSLNSIDFDPVLKLFPFFIIIISVIFYFYKELDIIVFGKEIAHSRGVDVKKVEFYFFIIVSMAVGGVISLCGPIGFVGLMVPHIIKMLFSLKHLKCAIACVFGGGTFLVVCDAISRTMISGNQLPVGIVTSSLGAPFFLYLLFRKK